MSAPTRLTTPSRGERPAALASEIVGGPVGRFAAIGRKGWTIAAAMLSALASVLIALGVLQKNYCVRQGWGSPGSLWHACYSDLPVAAASGGSNPWNTGGVGTNQPVLTAILSWFVGVLTPGGNALGAQQVYFAIGAVLIVVLIALTTLATASIVRGTPWLAAHVALSPVLITASLVSFDVFGVALATLGLAFWARRQPVAAGALLGAATMARSYPLILIAAIGLICLRDKRTEAFVRLVMGAVVVAVVSLAIPLALQGDPFAAYSNWWQQSSGYGAPVFLLKLAHLDVPGGALSVIAILGWVAAILVGLYFTGRPQAQTQVAPLALTMLVVVQLTGKTMSVQSCLWVLPLIAISAIRWRDHLIWAGVELTYFVMVWLYIAGPSNAGKAMPAAAYAFFLVVRCIAWIGLARACWEASEDLPKDPLGTWPQEKVPPAGPGAVSTGSTGHDAGSAADAGDGTGAAGARSFGSPPDEAG